MEFPYRARLLIGGHWKDAEPRVEIRSPFDGSTAGTHPTASAAELESAITEAQLGFEVLRNWPSHKRADVCRKTSAGISARADDLANLITRESGKPIQFSRAEVARAVMTFSIAAEEALRIGGEILPVDLSPATETFSAQVFRQPAGPVAAIAPFNFPLNLVAHKIAPALAAGCSIVLKPPPQAPLTALLLGEILMEAGAPEGSVSILPMDIALAEAMVHDDRFAVLSFTGSAKVGWHLKNTCGRKRIILELGGNAGAIVNKDAKLDWAARRLALSSFAAAGQVCIKAQRLFVDRDIYDAFLPAFMEETRKLQVGDPMNPETAVGPLIDEGSLRRVEQWVTEAVSAGGRILCGGERKGTAYLPTVIEKAPHDSKVWCEEIFGPVVTIEPFSEFGDAISMVNESSYGLQAGVFTRDLGLARRAIRDIHAGGVIINDSPMVRVDNYPYGGIKNSGYGREGVRYAIMEMTELKAAIFNHAGE